MAPERYRDNRHEIIGPSAEKSPAQGLIKTFAEIRPIVELFYPFSLMHRIFASVDESAGRKFTGFLLE